MQTSRKILVAASILAVGGGSFIVGHSGLPAAVRPELAYANDASVTTASPATSAALILGENTIADIAEQIAPAVVNIEVEQSGKQMNGLQLGGMPFEIPFGGNGTFKFYFNGQEVQPGNPPATPGKPGEPEKPGKTFTIPGAKNTGSGVIIRPDGYIVTNAHVVRGATNIKIQLNDSRVLPGKVVGIDDFSDIAIVKVEGSDFPTAKMGTSSNLRPGQFVIAIGSPRGYDHSVTLGIISAVNRQVTDVNGNINFIQTDAAINPGNSGGPLLNLHGEIIGINTAIAANAQNIGFSIPVDIAKTVCDGLIAHKPIVRPWLGIEMKAVDEVMAKSLGLDPAIHGILVYRVMENSPAKVAGLEPGDLIQKIDGKDMAAPSDVRDYVRAHKISDTLNLFVLRKGVPKAIAINIGQYPDNLAVDQEQSQP